MIIPDLNIPINTLQNFNFKTKAQTLNPAYQLLSGGALTGYLIAEQINAIRDVVSALMISTNNLIPAVNNLINHPARFTTFKTPDNYNLPQKDFICDFFDSDNILAIPEINLNTEFPDILQVNVTGQIDALYFPKIYIYRETETEDGTSIIPGDFPNNAVITFEIWINVFYGAHVESVNVPKNYLLLDNEEAFPSELEYLKPYDSDTEQQQEFDTDTDAGIEQQSTNKTSMVYVFPVRVSNLNNLNPGYPDVQISYAYRFIAGKEFVNIQQQPIETPSGTMEPSTENN